MQACLKFRDLEFEDFGDAVRIRFLRIFYFDIDRKDLEKISEFRLKDDSITFCTTQRKAENKFNKILQQGFSRLSNIISKKPAVYVHQNSGIPLIGTNYFGLVDRDTNIIELKPVTCCNMDCIYCSVAQDRREADFVVEKDYLVNEFRKLVRHKNTTGIEAHIGGQGEPLMYADIIGLVRDLSAIEEVSTVSIDTNGTLLSEKLVGQLVDAGLTRINLSVNSFEPGLAREIAGFPYDTERIKKLADIIASRISLIIAPVMLKGINESEMPKIIQFAKTLRKKHNKSDVWVGIQNFLVYRHGKKPVRQIEWDSFFAALKRWEKEHDIVLTKMPFEFFETAKLRKPFRRGDTVNAELVSMGRFRHEMIAAAGGRAIAVPNCNKDKGKVLLKIQRSKDNVFTGSLVGK